jgi:O-methyltransferase
MKFARAKNALSFGRAIHGKLLAQIRKEFQRKIYAQVRSFTMVDEGAFCDNLQLAERVRSIPGSVVECGVWRGGMSAGIACLLGNSRDYYLFDSFVGLPEVQSIDGPAAIAYQQNTSSPTYYDNCSAPAEFAQKAMNLVGANRYYLIPGFFDKTLPEFNLEGNIALLRLDGDWYKSTIICLQYLFEKVAEGGLIIIDDYYTWDGCSRAVHDFLSSRSARERIRSLNSVAYIVKEQDSGS